MKIWPWTKTYETPVDGPPIPTQVVMPDGATVAGKWVAGNFSIDGTVEFS